jgi:hypothetical protein
LAQKKTLDTAQNLENKQSVIFLPAKSMVLKVVTGKILETLELRPLSVACGSVLELQAGMALTDPARGLPRKMHPL